MPPAPPNQPVPASWLTPAEDGADLPLEIFPSVLMLAAGTLFQRNVFRPLLEPLGIGVAEWRVLISINLYGPATAADIVGRSWMDKAQISRAVAVLESQGLLSKAVDPAHAKRIILSTTAQGTRLFKQVYAQAQREQVKLLKLLDAGERRAMYQGLRKIIDYTQSQAP